ncbi:hypothetical protein EBAPG3_003880 [Nitrosospira lacus]|uniref:Uncharacterized protein n=2 Tax=Nitrosospira lacus TaxID=1288494 RepID=A0A1W6SMD8_9PROT|nr:hypothetical protein EBAPG3_003880 [Nitrosospira lacus]
MGRIDNIAGYMDRQLYVVRVWLSRFMQIYRENAFRNTLADSSLTRLPDSKKPKLPIECTGLRSLRR